MSEVIERGILSHADRRKPSVRRTFATLQVVVLAGLVVGGLGPLLWVAKSAVSTSQDILREPLAIFPSGVIQWDNIPTAWSDIQIGRYVGNSLALAAGCIVTSVVISVCTAYVLSVLKPAWGKVLSAAILATLFIPAVVVLVPLYLTALDLPLLGISLQNTYWAVWLVSAANPFNVLVVKRFFDAIPADLFEAARIDGANTWRILTALVIPLSRPILAVIALVSGFASWKDFLWPLIILTDPSIQPVSVALTKIASTADLSVQMAALFVALLLPVAVFLVFQRQFLRGVALSGGVKE